MVAHVGAEEATATPSVWLFAMFVRIVKVIELRVVHRSRDDIPSARPLSQIDDTATLTAERKIRIGGQYDLSAGRTT
jgi:hypothetical protein